MAYFNIHQFTREFWYTEGPIIIFPYIKGFWKVIDGGNMQKCTVDDELIDIHDGGEIKELPKHHGLYLEEFHWHREDHNWPIHPALIRHNAEKREKYLNDTDEMQEERDIKFKLECEKRKAIWEAKELKLQTEPEVAQKMAHFDWTWQEADRPNQAWSDGDRKVKWAFGVLESMPYVEAKRIWDEYGSGSYRGAGHPDWTKCEGFEYSLNSVRIRPLPENEDGVKVWEYCSGGLLKCWIDIAEVSPRSYRHHKDYTVLILNLIKAIDRDQIYLNTPVFSKGESYTTVAEVLDEAKRTGLYSSSFFGIKTLK